MCTFPGCKFMAESNGYCIRHQFMAGTPIAKKERKPIPAKSKKRVEKEKAQKQEKGPDHETDLQQWFNHIMATEKPVCWETGEEIDTTEPDQRGWRGSIAHVLPKKLFKSVATHPDNYLILKMYGGTHDRYDSSWAKAQKMKVWPEAVRRFVKIYPSIADSEKKYIPDCLIKHLPEE